MHRILLVEDNPADARLVREALTEGQLVAELQWVATGEEALQALRRHDARDGGEAADMVLLDLNLPGMSGHEGLAEMKRDAVLKRTPVVVLSSSNHATDVGRAYDAHANAYMIKPQCYEDFVALVVGIRDYWLTSVQLPARLS